MADEFKIGDVVRLRAGGPLMVVKTIAITALGVTMIGCTPLVEASERQSEREFEARGLVMWN